MAYNLVPLSDIGKISTGNTPPKNSNKYYNSDDIMFVKPNDIDSEKITEIITSKEYLSLIGADLARRVNKGAVLVTCIGTIGKVGIANEDLCFNQQINSIEVNESIIDNKFLAYSIVLRRKQLEAIANAPVVPIINKTQFSHFQIPLPPLLIQKKIVQILDKAQELIDLREQQLKLLDDLVQSVFYDMFGDPVTNPKGWEVKELGYLSKKICSGTTPKGGNQVYVNKGITFFRSQNVWRNKLVFEDIAYIDNSTHNAMKKSSLKKGDILMTKTGRFNTENSSLGRAAMFLGEDGSANINGHVYLIRLKEIVNREFVLYILTTKVYREYIRRVCVGGIDKRQINKTHLEEFPIILPPISLQNEFAEKVQKIEEQKVLMQESLKQMKDNYNSLMQRAFKGELFPE